MNLIKKIIRKLIYKKVTATHTDEKIVYPEYSLYEHVEYTANKYKHYEAYEYFGKIATYEEFLKQIEVCARSLKALGVKEGDPVTICMPNTPQSIIMFYAVNKIGAIANLIHPLSAEKEIEYYLNLSKSKYILVIDIAIEKLMNIVDNTKIKNIVLTSAAEDMSLLMKNLYWLTSGRKIKEYDDERIMSWNKFLKKAKNFTAETKVETKMENPAIILYTGGTTGKSKGVVLSNANFTALAVQGKIMCEPCKEGDSSLSIMPIFHGLGLGVCIHIPLTVGMKCILLPTFKPQQFVKLIKKYQPNFVVGVPSLFEGMSKNYLKEDALKCIKCTACGGDTLSVKSKKAIDKYLKDHGSSAQMREGYGLTECSGASCTTPKDVYKEGSIGLPFPDMNYKIIRMGTYDEAFPYEDGEICINGPTVMLGYLNDKEETAQVLLPHDDGKVWLHTGDIGYKDEDGYVFFKSRLKRMIISSGYNIYPSQIEKVLDSHPLISMCTVVGIPHKYKGQVVKAYIVLEDDVEATPEVKKSIKDLCKKNLATYALPYEFDFRTSLPKTLVGKINYNELSKENIKSQKKER